MKRRHYVKKKTAKLVAATKDQLRGSVYREMSVVFAKLLKGYKGSDILFFTERHTNILLLQHLTQL